MKSNSLTEYFGEHLRVVEQSLEQLHGQAEEVSAMLIKAMKNGSKVIAFGNGGSATQASHLAGELLGRFARTRSPLPAIALNADPAVVTCISNDFGYETVFERQIQALARDGDVAIGFTTSGRSASVIRALVMAKGRGAVTVALTGADGLVGGTADYLLPVPSTSTANIQEVHLMLLHVWCVHLDSAFKDSD